MANYMVVGLGSIGGSVAKSIKSGGDWVSGIKRTKLSKRACDVDRIAYCDVSERFGLGHLVPVITPPSGKFDGVVYAVGNCPPGGFDEEVRTPFLDKQIYDLEMEMRMQYFGLYTLISYLLHYNLIADHARIVVIGSAITRFVTESASEQLPSDMYPYHYVAAKAAQEAATEGIRQHLAKVLPGAKVILLKPGAVDTAFHKGSRFSPPKIESLESFTEKVLEALKK